MMRKTETREFVLVLVKNIIKDIYLSIYMRFMCSVYVFLCVCVFVYNIIKDI